MCYDVCIMNEEITITRCQCGAVTVSTDDWSNSMTVGTFREEYPNEHLPPKTYGSCDHCVNHWGIDLCGCGSGEAVGECSNRYYECRNKLPAQVKGEAKEFVGWR